MPDDPFTRVTPSAALCFSSSAYFARRAFQPEPFRTLRGNRHIGCGV
jgi:hypothetical protein